MENNEFNRNSRAALLKRKAAEYLGLGTDQPLSKADQRRIQAKAKKMKLSKKKSERQQMTEFAKNIIRGYSTGQ